MCEFVLSSATLEIELDTNLYEVSTSALWNIHHKRLFRCILAFSFYLKVFVFIFLQWVVMCWRNWRIVKFFGDWQWENNFDFSLFLENNYILQACLVVIPLNILGNLKQHCSQNQGSLGVFLANHSLKKKKNLKPTKIVVVWQKSLWI